MRLALRLYRAALVLLPASLRREHGDEMTQIVQERLLAARRVSGRRGEIAVLARGLADLVAASIAARLPERDRWSLLRDARMALRTLRREPGFTAAATLTLAVCVGANTAIFTVVHGIVLKPLPLAESGRLVSIHNSYPGAGLPRAANNPRDFLDRREGMPALEELAIYRRRGVTLMRPAGAERVMAIEATPSLMRVLGVRPAAGRVLTDADAEVGRHDALMLTPGLWQSMFGGETSVVGSRVELAGRPFEVVGVLPSGFTFLHDDVDLWIPAAFTAEQTAEQARHSNLNWQMIGRLAPGATIGQAQDQLDAVNARNTASTPEFQQVLQDAGFRSFVVDLQDDLVREIRPALLLLWAGVLVVLLVGSVNLANLVLLRSTRRSGELATRLALGATAGRVRRQVFTEAIVLSLAGGGAGLGAGWSALRAGSVWRLDELPRGFEVTLDATVVLIAVALSLLVGVLLAVPTAARVSRLDVASALRHDTRTGTAGRRIARVRRTLAMAQVALTLVLLIGAGLLFTSFREVLAVDPGFDPDGVVTASVTMPAGRFDDEAAIHEMRERLLGAVRSLPGTRAAAATTVLPLGGTANNVILPEGHAQKPGEPLLSATFSRVTDGYFEAMGIAVLRGRAIARADDASAPPVVVVDQRLAETFWPGENPLGRRVYEPQNGTEALSAGPSSRFMTVIGVVEEVKADGLAPAADAIGAYYTPIAQAPTLGFTIVARGAGAPDPLGHAIRGAIRTIDPALPVFDVSTMTARLDASLVPRRLPMLLSAAFAGIALLLSAIGVYGVLAWTVAERRREIGLRLALGSTTHGVFRLMLADGLRLVVPGLAIGLTAGLAGGRAMRGLLFGVGPFEPLVVGSVAGLLAAVALLAIVLPARRAMRISPMVSLKG